MDIHLRCSHAGMYHFGIVRIACDLERNIYQLLSEFIHQINVCGMMEAWGLTIDLVSCIGLELAVGLCVDYGKENVCTSSLTSDLLISAFYYLNQIAAHVGHTFLVTGPGTKSERALETVTHIVPAVMYGGFSMLLAVSMLANSEAYTFQAFFKVIPFWLLLTWISFNSCLILADFLAGHHIRIVLWSHIFACDIEFPWSV